MPLEVIIRDSDNKSPSPRKKRSKSPKKKRSPSPRKKRSPSPRKKSPTVRPRKTPPKPAKASRKSSKPQIKYGLPLLAYLGGVNLYLGQVNDIDVKTREVADRYKKLVRQLVGDGGIRFTLYLGKTIKSLNDSHANRMVFNNITDAIDKAPRIASIKTVVNAIFAEYTNSDIPKDDKRMERFFMLFFERMVIKVSDSLFLSQTVGKSSNYIYQDNLRKCIFQCSQFARQLLTSRKWDELTIDNILRNISINNTMITDNIILKEPFDFERLFDDLNKERGIVKQRVVRSYMYTMFLGDSSAISKDVLVRLFINCSLRKVCENIREGLDDGPRNQFVMDLRQSAETDARSAWDVQGKFNLLGFIGESPKPLIHKDVDAYFIDAATGLEDEYHVYFVASIQIFNLIYRLIEFICAGGALCVNSNMKITPTKIDQGIWENIPTEIDVAEATGVLHYMIGRNYMNFRNLVQSSYHIADFAVLAFLDYLLYKFTVSDKNLNSDKTIIKYMYLYRILLSKAAFFNLDKDAFMRVYLISHSLINKYDISRILPYKEYESSRKSLLIEFMTDISFDHAHDPDSLFKRISSKIKCPSGRNTCNLGQDQINIIRRVLLQHLSGGKIGEEEEDRQRGFALRYYNGIKHSRTPIHRLDVPALDVALEIYRAHLLTLGQKTTREVSDVVQSLQQNISPEFFEKLILNTIRGIENTEQDVKDGATTVDYSPDREDNIEHIYLRSVLELLINESINNQIFAQHSDMQLKALRRVLYEIVDTLGNEKIIINLCRKDLPFRAEMTHIFKRQDVDFDFVEDVDMSAGENLERQFHHLDASKVPDPPAMDTTGVALNKDVCKLMFSQFPGATELNEDKLADIWGKYNRALLSFEGEDADKLLDFYTERYKCILEENNLSIPEDEKNTLKTAIEVILDTLSKCHALVKQN